MTPTAIAFLLATAVVIPALAYASKREIDRGLVIPRLPFYAEGIALQTLLLAGSFYVASRNRIIVFRRFDPHPRDFLLGFGLFALAMLAMWMGWRVADSATKQRLALLVPVTATERIVWSAVSLSASFAEEIAYRSVLITLVQRLLRNWWIAAVISSALFALAHLLQGWRSAVIVAVFGLLFHLLVRATGGLYPAIAVHFAYDLAAGFIVGSRIADLRSRISEEPGSTEIRDPRTEISER